MLRCPPSRINLTSSDIAGFEQRFAVRHNAHLTRPSASNVRLSPGPGRATSLSIVPAEHNFGRKRAASSSSEATLHNDHNEQVDTGPAGTWISSDTSSWAVDSPTKPQDLSNDQSALCSEAARALGNVIQQSQSPPTKASPRRQVDSFYGTEQALNTRGQSSSANANSFRDGTIEVQADPTPVDVRFGIHFSRDESSVLGEISNDARSLREPQSEPRPFSSARARRRHPRSQDYPVDPIVDEFHASGTARTADRSAQSSSETTPAALPVPDLILPSELPESSTIGSLDPGAPVFIPRIRFGTATGSSTEGGVPAALDPQWSSVDSKHSSSNLRIRSLSEQNREFSSNPRQQLARDVLEAPGNTAHRRNDINALPRHRRRSRTTDQNTAIPSFAPNLERYPLLQTPSILGSYRRTSTLNPPGALPAIDGTLRLPSSSSEGHQSAANLGHARNHLLITQNDAIFSNAAGLEGATVRSVSPAISTNSRSTPNLLQRPISPGRIYSRGSSLTWSQTGTRTPSANFVPRMVSAASGISGGDPASRQSSREGLDAAAEFLRMRNSPLDDLTERLSRLSSSRLRSVGHSWERPPSNRPRVSLLTGDPFRPEPSSNPAAAGPISTLLEQNPTLAEPDTVDEVDAIAEDLVALSLALPPSSSLSSSPLPSTPQFRNSTKTSSPQCPQAERSPVKSCGSPEISIKRKPVPSASKTPRVQVYDDSKPPLTQPRTSADVRRSTRRAKTRSDTTAQQSPIFVGRAKISSPPPIPERNQHRNTYPPATPQQTNASAPARDAPSSASVPPAPTSDASHERTTIRAQMQRSSDQAENDMEGHHPVLEHDRQTWLSRREDGTLEVTPPKQGRFERYLS
ncbi:hypothetical protein LTR37_008233 [Vermiconidia calcicola]|uniref:Uncharacterized protein n=1 Tax=Vermiconidia calcicola TaxID=1690605 RepID=A0ACC3NC68_9PEZI|nr:hypothetical protein LTR37_008233 [Vermiconidia calcicola]